ncbi:MAG TPA: GDSL-type esterase/lipase family protein [Gammaproteobacteria bacterium]|nr:GDSL-type esterase/lipase family protein [Gammaproteobacteria bacterium]
MRAYCTRLSVALVSSILALAPNIGAAQSVAASSPSHVVGFAADIDAFLDRDKTAPPPKHAILFVGSSIFRRWTTLTEQMAPLPVFNRAFGGSRTWEVLAYMDKIVLPYEPDIIVYYCGSNDVNAAEPADAIVTRFEQFVTRVAERLPDTRVFFVSINRSPDKRARWNVVDDANAQIKAFAYATPNLDYIEVNPVLFDARDEPLTDLYLEDGLHFKPPAYEELTKIIEPVVARAWSERH